METIDELKLNDCCERRTGELILEVDLIIKQIKKLFLSELISEITEYLQHKDTRFGLKLNLKIWVEMTHIQVSEKVNVLIIVIHRDI
jgi:hypothetical protein